MKALRFITLPLALAGGAFAQDYTNFIRQVQMPQPGGTTYDLSVSSSGTDQLSPLAIEPGGARFELWTVKSGSPATSTLLDTRYVSTYTPVGSVTIRNEETILAAANGEAPPPIPRTRADRSFYVDITVNGLRSGATDPDPSKSVKFLRHVQSYGTGNGVDIDRTQATLYSQASITGNGAQTLTYSLTSIPGADRSKVRGEERFSLYTLADYQAPESQLASQFIQIWPVADGNITGISSGASFRFKMPQLTMTANDLYPKSTTYAQVYPGAPRLGETGSIVPGSALILNESVPQSRVFTLQNYEYLFDADGQWTLELLTSTPFGIDRLFYVSFTVNRSIKVISTVTTIE